MNRFVPLKAKLGEEADAVAAAVRADRAPFLQAGWRKRHRYPPNVGPAERHIETGRIRFRPDVLRDEPLPVPYEAGWDRIWATVFYCGSCKQVFAFVGRRYMITQRWCSSTWSERGRPSPKPMRSCRSCGAPVASPRHHCSNACRQRAYRQRRAAEKAAA